MRSSGSLENGNNAENPEARSRKLKLKASPRNRDTEQKAETRSRIMKEGSEVNFWLRERLNDNDLALLQQNLAEFTKDNSKLLLPSSPSADLQESSKSPQQQQQFEQHNNEKAFIINGATNTFNTMDDVESSQPSLKNASKSNAFFEVVFISIFTFDIKKNKCLSLNSISNKFPCQFEKEILPN